MDAFSQNDDPETPPITVVVVDHDEWLLGTAVPYDAALTIWATMSEDPANWDEVADHWRRYRCPSVCEFVDGLAIQTGGREESLKAIQGHSNWLAIDMVQKRIMVGDGVQSLGRKATLAMDGEEEGGQCCPLPFCIPPWWELHESAASDVVAKPRESEMVIPRTDRAFLYGSPMLETFATRILEAGCDGRLPGEDFNDREADNALHGLTVEVHMDWLMTPRADLSGRCPRVLLHGAHDWSDAVIWGQQQRFENGVAMIAAPDDVVGYDDAPMGREEMILYFDLCRELIQAGWSWCERESNEEWEGDASDDRRERLIACLSAVRDAWWDQSYEGGSPPSFIVECSRRRVPRGSEVPIEGMDGIESEEHVADCDCPICDMMASGLFGVGFTSLSGDHLELDNEFAFSTYEFREDWQREQNDYLAFSEEMDRKQALGDAGIAAGESEAEEYASAWSSPMSDQGLPGDPRGHLKLSFRLAEIIGDWKQAGAADETIKRLNRSFHNYRECTEDERANAKVVLQATLEEVAAMSPPLLPKVADFLSQVDAQERATIENRGRE
ncbi:hypothetical protein [Rhodopirellula sp. P2]|uniref:hypothetical protein n=1 Tax=Rhodopirellula sp. P2 TaxID=2127060 RepID=UPI0023681CD1|nr:hypothetical protein [Rhodopirellula sp. P2]WDQ14952.1 hypothetical protein PSR62_15030 [Rhodopirellula sp. P2]